MASAYFNAAIDNKWDTTGNWWADSGFTVPLGTPSQLPEIGDDIYVYATIDGYVSFAPVTLNNGYFYGNGFNGVSALVASIDLSFSGDVTLDDGYALAGYIPGPATGPTWTVSGTITFNDNSSIGGAGGYYYPVSLTAGSVVFNNTSGGGASGSTITGNTTLNNSSSIGYIIFNSDVNLNDTSSIYYDTSHTNYIYGSTIHLYDSSSIDTVQVSTGMTSSTLHLHDTTSATNITGSSCCYNAVIYYPGSATFSGSSYNIYYANYPTLYLWNTLGSAIWDSLNDWWVDSAHTQPTYTLPDSNTDTIIDSNVTSGTGSTVKSLTISNANYVAISTITVVDNATFNNSSYIDSLGTVSGPCIFKDTSYNNGTVDGTATFGIDNGSDTSYNAGTINGTADFYANCYTYNNTTCYGAINFYDSSYASYTISNSSTVSFHDLSTNFATLSGTVDFNNSSSNTSAGFLDIGIFNDSSINSGYCNNATYNDGSIATSASYLSNLVLTITGNPVASYSMDTGTFVYSFTRGGGGGGGGINGSSILGIL